MSEDNTENSGELRCSTAFLFDVGEKPVKPRKNPEKLMHVYDAGSGEDNWCMVMMHCSRCDLYTDWFQVRTVTEAKRGIPCPRCNGVEFKTNEYEEYIVPESSQ